MNRPLVILVLVGCGKSGVSGELILTGAPRFSPVECGSAGTDLWFDGATEYPGKRQTGRLSIHGTTLRFTPPGPIDLDAVTIDSRSCSIYEVDGDHVRLDCDAQAGRRLVGLIEHGACR